MGDDKLAAYKSVENVGEDVSDRFVMIQAAKGMKRSAYRLKAAIESNDDQKRTECVEEITLVLSMLLKMLNKDEMTEAVDAYHEILSYMLAITLKLDRQGGPEDVDQLIESFDKMERAWETGGEDNPL